jgi:acetyl esterase/lipase
MKKVVFIILALYVRFDIHAQLTFSSDTNILKRTFVYKTVGTTQIHADFYQANDYASSPAIIWIHGGALMFGSRADIPLEQLKLYLKAGYSVLSIDYRLAPETKLPEIIKDVTDGIEWTRNTGHDLLKIDTAHIFVVGQSGGAYLALMTGYLMPKPPKGIISFYGYGTILEDWYNKPDSFACTKTPVTKESANKLIGDSTITEAPVRDRLDLYIYSRQKGIWPQLVTGHDPKKEAKWFNKYSPVKNIHSNYPPVLLIHGDKDLDVPFIESLFLDKKLTEKKVRHRFIRMKNYGHLFDIFEGGLSNPDVNKTFTDVIMFLNSCNKSYQRVKH